MEYLIRFIQVHETFRIPEIEALAELEGISLEIVSYSLDVCLLPNIPYQPRDMMLIPL